jgi:hypothetical protein
MWLFMALSVAVDPDRFCIQVGIWACQTRVWPRTFLPLEAAQLETRSPLVNVKLPWDGSVASGFISFSAVIMSNSRLATVV